MINREEFVLKVVKVLRGLYKHNISFSQAWKGPKGCLLVNGSASIANIHGVYINIGYVGGKKLSTKKVGIIICQLLAEAGINYEWDTDPDYHIKIPYPVDS